MQMQVVRTVKTILDVKGRQVYTVTPETNVYTALELMDEKGIGAVLVVNDQDKVLGILSERDYARKVSLKGKTAKDTSVTEIMTENVIYVEPSQPIEECMALMVGKHIRHLPVLEDDKLAGIISIGDVVKTMITEQQMLIEQLESYIRGY